MRSPTGEVIPEDGDPEVDLLRGRVRAAQPAAAARDGSGPRSAARTRSPAGRRGRGCAPPTPAPPGSGTCSPPTSWARTSCSGTSSRARPGPGSWSSAATCAPSTRPPIRIAIVCDNFSPHLTTRKDSRVGDLGRGEQRRDRLHADEFVLVKPHRGPVHRPALLRARRHRPRQPQGAGQHDPPVHHLAQQPRLRRTAPPHRRQGKRSLMRHQGSPERILPGNGRPRATCACLTSEGSSARRAVRLGHAERPEARPEI